MKAVMIEASPKNKIVYLSDLGLIQVTGKNSAQFLQGQLSCDVSEINEKQSRLGVHCDAKGRVQATFRLFSYQDAYYFLLPRSMIPHLIQCLQKYAVFSAVSLIDVTKNWKMIGLVNPSIANRLDEYTLLPEQDNGVVFSATTISLAITNARFILLTPHELYSEQWGTESMSLNDWYLLDIMAGIATIYPQTIAQFTPHQLNYPAIGGVSFTKGCYIGQEIIARTQYLGKSKSRLYRVMFKAKHNFPPGSSIQDQGNVRQGTLIMNAQVKEQTYQALACLQSQAISHTIHLKDSQGPVLQPLELPYMV